MGSVTCCLYRLRAERLYSAEAVPYLSVSLNVVKTVFIVDLRYHKKLHDPLSGHTFLSNSWQSSSTGRHFLGEGIILSAVRRHVDRFAAEFLRVNEAACTKR